MEQHKLSQTDKRDSSLSLATASVPTPSATNVQAIGNTSLSCNKVKVSQYEAYLFDNELQGFHVEQWEQLTEDYQKLIGEASNDTLFQLCRTDELKSYLFDMHTLIDLVISLYLEGVYSYKLINILKREFRPKQFTHETLKEDIEFSRAKLKRSEIEFGKLVEELSKDTKEDDNRSFFDAVLVAYGRVFKFTVLDKERVSLAAFAIMYKDLQSETTKNTITEDGY